jgi:hypothetical protein
VYRPFDRVVSTSQFFAADWIQLFIPPERAHRFANRGAQMSALKPHLMTAAERLDEVAEILAAGLMRARAKQSSPQSADYGESSLDCPADQSVHANVLNGDVE